MAAEIKGFTIDGELCEFAQVFSFALDEAQVLYDNTGLTIEDFLPFADEDEDKDTLLDEKLKNPGFVRTLMHVAYQRKHPGMPAHKVKALIGKQSLVTALQELAGAAAEEDDALPPESTTEQEPSSPRSSVEKNESSGNGSPTSSDGQVVPLTPTTTIGSGISSTPSPASSAV